MVLVLNVLGFMVTFPLQLMWMAYQSIVHQIAVSATQCRLSIIRQVAARIDVKYVLRTWDQMHNELNATFVLNHFFLMVQINVNAHQVITTLNHLIMDTMEPVLHAKLMRFFQTPQGIKLHVKFVQLIKCRIRIKTSAFVTRSSRKMQVAFVSVQLASITQLQKLQQQLEVVNYVVQDQF